VIELMTEHQDSASAEANLEQSGNDRLNGKNLTPDSGECLGS